MKQQIRRRLAPLQRARTGVRRCKQAPLLQTLSPAVSDPHWRRETVIQAF